MAVHTPAMKCARCLIFLLNVIFLIVSTILLTLGIQFYTSYNDLEVFLETPYFGPAAIIISVAVILLLVSLLGYVGAMKESVFIVNTYSFMLTILLILEIAATITAFISSNKYYQIIQENMKNSLHHYTTDPIKQSAWDTVQKHYLCCGVYRPFDWADQNVTGIPVEQDGITFQVPTSCCIESTKYSKGEIYTSGCWGVLGTELSSAVRVLGYSVLNIGILQLIGIVFSSILGKCLRRAKSLEEMDRQINAYKRFKIQTKIRPSLTNDNSVSLATQAREA